jgi:mannose-6-phosphate isomerase-like protein (cupin superfamily)
MLIKRTQECNEFTANDGCRIREILHPRNDPADLPYSLAWCRLEPGGRSYAHVLKQAEVYYILQGRGRMHVADETAEVGHGDAVFIPGGAGQWLENIGPDELIFTVIVSPPWREEDDILV